MSFDLIETLKTKRERILNLIEQSYCNRMTEKKYEAVRQEVKDIFNDLWTKISTESSISSRTEGKRMMEPITKCKKCGVSYEDEYDRMTESWKKKTKHLQLSNCHTFEDSLGTQYGWSVQVICKCGNKFTFEDST
jgi:predicted Zn-ribbon and HTH transcriptional regulator